MKNNLKTIGAIVFIITVLLLVVIASGIKQEANMDAYAKANHCTWKATGTMYGDNRDFVCIKGESK